MEVISGSEFEAVGLSLMYSSQSDKEMIVGGSLCSISHDRNIAISILLNLTSLLTKILCFDISYYRPLFPYNEGERPSFDLDGLIFMRRVDVLIASVQK